MLILQRKVNDVVLVFHPAYPDPIAIQVVEIRRGKVKLGIDAPVDVAIWREELAPARPVEAN